MNSIWNNVYDKVKDRRYGALFTMAAVSSLGAFVVGKIVIEEVGPIDLTPYLPGVLVLGVAMIWRQWRLSCRPRQRLNFAPLSNDELRKARCKLTRKGG
jgi:hypothetical protein